MFYSLPCAGTLVGINGQREGSFFTQVHNHQDMRRLQ
jgi:hypothetical protein